MPTAVHAAATITSPPLPISLTMDAYRDALFRVKTAARLHQGLSTGQNVSQIVQAIAAEQLALAQAITEPEFIKTATVALIAAQQQGETNPRYQTKPETVAEEITQILQRRATEMRNYAAEVVKESFYALLVNQPPASKDTPITPSLYDVKMHEVLEDLLHRDANGAPQVIAHIESTAKGMRIEHDALAILFNANGPLHIPLMAAIQRHLPDASNDHIHQLTLDWLSARAEAAKLTADLASETGAAYQEAIRISTEYHGKKYAAATVPPAGFAERIRTQVANNDLQLDAF